MGTKDKSRTGEFGAKECGRRQKDKRQVEETAAAASVSGGHHGTGVRKEQAVNKASSFFPVASGIYESDDKLPVYEGWQ